MPSRYGLLPDPDLKRAALNLNMGEGSAARLGSSDFLIYLQRAEYQVEAECSDFIAVPLKPIAAPGLNIIPTPTTPDNYPVEFIQAVIYCAVGYALHSEFFDAEPNVSQSAEWAETEFRRYLMNFRSRPSINVGAGRRRHPNPHMPPAIAPKENPNNESTGVGLSRI